VGGPPFSLGLLLLPGLRIRRERWPVSRHSAARILMAEDHAELAERWRPGCAGRGALNRQEARSV
jgi:hypothetical protein